MHPPGYPFFTTAGYLITRVPWVDPAYMVSFASMVVGLAVLWQCVALTARFGASVLIGGVAALFLGAHPRFWSSLVAPEVYTPSLLITIGAVLVFLRYAATGRWLWIALSGLLLGLGFANRPPIGLLVPFFIAALWMTDRRLGLPFAATARRVSLAAACSLIPVVYTLGYIWARDHHATPYNYIDQHNAAERLLPDSSLGAKAKFERMVWHATAAQFKEYFGSSWRGVRAKLRWLRHEMWPGFRPTLYVSLVIVLAGLAVAWRRDRATALLLAGVAVQAVVFVCAYRIHGQAADILPLLFVCAVFGGAALSPVFSRHCGGGRLLVAGGLLLSACVWTIATADQRPKAGISSDAAPFLGEADPQSLPPRSVIFSGWHHAIPLRYDLQVGHRRRDVDLIVSMTNLWPGIFPRFADRPIYIQEPIKDGPGFTTVPERNLWRVILNPSEPR